MAKRKKRTSLIDRLRERVAAIELSHLRRAGIVLVWIAGGVGLVALWTWSVPRLSAYAAERGTVDRVEIRFDQAPAWVRGDLLELLEMNAVVQLSGDPMQQSELIDIRTALLNTGWFEEVDQVRREQPNVIVVEGTFVRPYAVVRCGNRDHLIDPTGRLLPRSYHAGRAHERLIVIAGVRFDTPQRPGLRWPGTDVTAALRLIDMMQRRAWFRQVDQLDMSQFMRDDSISLITDRGCRIIWGSAPGEERALETLADMKLRYLDEHYELSQHIDRGHVGTLDLTRREGVFAR